MSRASTPKSSAVRQLLSGSTLGRWVGRLTRSLAICSIAAALAGCGYVKRVGECRRLAADVNAALDAIAQARDAGGDTPETHRDVATRYEQLSERVSGTPTENMALARNLEEYSAFLKETARTLRALGLALDKNDAVSAGRHRRDLGNLVRREKSLVARIDGACTGP